MGAFGFRGVVVHADRAVLQEAAQRRSRFALMPWPIATAAIDMPGCMHEATKLALKSSL